MSRNISCPSCGESEELNGRPSPDGIVIDCATCGASWLRDAILPTCATCGGTEVEERPRALTQYSRGTQLSIVGVGSILLCKHCDARMVEWVGSHKPVPFSYRSAALHADSVRPGNTDDPIIRIEP